MTVAIVSDTCHYLPAELAAEQGIHQVSLYVHWAEGAQRESEISDYDAYYRRLGADTTLPTTSQPSIGDFLAVYERGRLHPLGRRHVRDRARRRAGSRSAR
jgi:fatty acid-binding protein DegV